MPGLTFPPVGRLGLTSPLSPVLPAGLSFCARLRLPIVRLGFLCFRLSTDTLVAPSVRVLACGQTRQRSGTLASTPGLLGHPVRLFRVAHKETSGSPKPVLSEVEGFPGYPFKYMPRSPTPVVSSVLALTHSGLLPSASLTASAFPPKKLAVTHCPQLYKFRGSITRPVFLLPLASDSRYRTDPQGSLPACWLGFGWVGLAPTG